MFVWWRKTSQAEKHTWVLCGQNLSPGKQKHCICEKHPLSRDLELLFLFAIKHPRERTRAEHRDRRYRRCDSELFPQKCSSCRMQPMLFRLKGRSTRVSGIPAIEQCACAASAVAAHPRGSALPDLIRGDARVTATAGVPLQTPCVTARRQRKGRKGKYSFSLFPV